MGARRPAGADTAFLTGMRGIAALLVFVFHSGGLGLRGLGEMGNNFADAARFGVAIFFVISAYCLCLVTERAWEGEAVDWRAFYIRRAFRVLPLYFVMLAINVAVLAMSGSAPADLAYSVLAHITFLNVFDVAYNNNLLSVEWTITVELAFYVVFPLVLRTARWATVGLLPIALLLADADLRLMVANALGPDHAALHGHTLVWYAFAFVLGVAAYVVQRNFRCNRAVAEAIAAGSGAMLIWTMVRPMSLGSTEVVMAVATSGLIVACGNPDILLARLLRTRIFVLAGTISFSIYLLHFLVLGLLPKTDLGAAFALVLTLALAALSYRYVETPFREIGRRLTQRLGASAVAGQAAGGAARGQDSGVP